MAVAAARAWLHARSARVCSASHDSAIAEIALVGVRVRVRAR